MTASTSYEETKRRRRLLFDSTAADILEDTLFDEKSNSAYIHSILHKDFENDFKTLPKHLRSKFTESRTLLDRMKQEQLLTVNPNDSQQPLLLLGSTPETKATSTALSVYSGDGITSSSIPQATGEYAFADKLLVPRNTTKPKPQAKYHSNWKLQRVVLGHTGQVHSLTFDPLNKFFVTGSSDRTIKIWDLATSQLQLTLTGHIMAVRGLAISDRHPYMFSCSEDKTVKCWDLEKNRIVRDYHGHLSSVYTIDVHPTLDLIVTAGRDSAVRVWDIRTKLPVYTLTGHKSTVNKIKCRATEPQIISCSMDSTVRTWDLVAGKCRDTLTYHSKSVRSFTLNEVGDEFVSGSSDGLKKFKLPQCEYLQDMGVLTNDKMSEGNIIVNSICCNAENVMFVGCDNGQYGFWDWDNGQIFQQGINVPVPGSLSSESGILCSGFDHSGLRLVTGGVDKSIKVWKQVDE